MWSYHPYHTETNTQILSSRVVIKQRRLIGRLGKQAGQLRQVITGVVTPASPVIGEYQSAEAARTHTHTQTVPRTEENDT